MVYILFYAVLHKLCLSGRYNKRIIKLAVSGFLSTPDYCCFLKRESDTNPERNRLKTFWQKNCTKDTVDLCCIPRCIILVFGLGEFYFNITNILQILIKLPVFFCLMILTAAFTEEVFFRGILQRTMMDSLKKPYLAILLTGILFGLYHFPFAYYLWDDTAGNIMYSLRMVMTEHVLTGCAFGFIYYKSNKNLWSCIILHAFTNAAIMALGTVFST